MSIYPDINGDGYLLVKLHQYEGDWFMIPNSREEEFLALIESDRLNVFEEKFGALRTGGDLNNIQFYRRVADIIDETLAYKPIP